MCALEVFIIFAMAQVFPSLSCGNGKQLQAQVKEITDVIKIEKKKKKNETSFLLSVKRLKSDQKSARP